MELTKSHKIVVVSLSINGVCCKQSNDMYLITLLHVVNNYQTSNTIKPRCRQIRYF